MLDKLKELAKEQSTDFFVEETDVPNEYAEQSAEAAGQTIYDTLKEAVKSGDSAAVKDLISGKTDLKNDDLVKKIKANFKTNLSEQTGVDEKTAEQASDGSIVAIIEQMIEKFLSKDAKDADFDIMEFIKMLLSTEGRRSLLEAIRDMITEKFGETAGNLFSNLFRLDAKPKEVKLQGKLKKDA